MIVKLIWDGRRAHTPGRSYFVEPASGGRFVARQYWGNQLLKAITCLDENDAKHVCESWENVRP